MSFGKYAMECYKLAEELLDSISPNDVLELKKRLADYRTTDWLKWRIENANLVSEFVASTPSQRNRQKKFQAQKQLLILASYQHCLEAHATLTMAEEVSFALGTSYREMAARAGDALNRFYGFEIPNWPFGDTESPFIEDDPFE